MYEDSWFRYFALSTAMRWHALQAVWIYVRQHPHNARLSIEKLHDMVGHEVNPFKIMCLLMLLACMEHGSIGSSSGVGSWPWLTHLVYPLLPTVQLTYSDQS